MSKTTPVRWWRDDATRYASRPLVGVCRTRPEQHAWAFELISGPSTLTAALAELEQQIMAACAVPLGPPDR